MSDRHPPLYIISRSPHGRMVVELDNTGYGAAAVNMETYDTILRLGVACLNTGLSEKALLKLLDESAPPTCRDDHVENVGN